MMRKSLAFALVMGLVAATGAARAEDLGGKISGAFTDAYKGLRDGILGAYDTSTKGAVEKWNDVTGKASPAAQAAPVGTAAEVQRELIAAGYNPGPVDGRFGPMTGNAIRAYQYDNGLPADGQISQALLDHLLVKRTAQGVGQTAAATPATPTLPAPATLPPQPPANQAAQDVKPGAQNCQPYKTRTMVNGQEAVTDGKLCLQADGTWKPVN